MKHAFSHLIRRVSQLFIFWTYGSLSGSGQQLLVVILHKLVNPLKTHCPDFRLPDF
jgi:hypothetical protein